MPHQADRCAARGVKAVLRDRVPLTFFAGSVEGTTMKLNYLHC